MLVAPFFIAGNKLTKLDMVSSNSSSDASSVVVPSDVRAGDLLICCNMGVKTSSVAATVPSGFTKILPTPDGGFGVNISGTTYYFHNYMSYKIAVGTEGSTTLNSMSFTGSVNPGSAMLIAVFRGNRKITGVTIKDQSSTGSVDGNLTETITSGSGSVPLLPLAWYVNLAGSWSNVDQRIFTPGPDDEIIFGVSNMCLRWKFYGATDTPSNTTSTMTDAPGGSAPRRHLMCTYLELDYE